MITALTTVLARLEAAGAQAGEVQQLTDDAQQLAASIGATRTVEGLADVRDQVDNLLICLEAAQSTARVTLTAASGLTSNTATVESAASTPRSPPRSGGNIWTRAATGVVGGVPTGPRTKVDPSQDQSVIRSLQRENDVADVLAGSGYRVRQNPSKDEVAEARRQTGDLGNPRKNPDYLIEGHVFDCYAPSDNRSPRNIWTEVSTKVTQLQTQRVVLHLREWRGDLGALHKQFADWPVSGLKEIVAVTPSGTIIEITNRAVD